MSAHIPSPLLWEITRSRSAYTVKRRSGGGAEFSRDPLNLLNKHTRTQDGYINDKAIGIQSAEKNGLTLLTKIAGKSNKPASSIQSSTFSSATSTRKIYRTIVNTTAKKGYRPDLRAAAVKRASAVRRSQKPVKADAPIKLRGTKAKRAAQASS